MALSRVATSEDAWLFTGGSWIDIGYDEEKTEVLLDLALVTAAVREQEPREPLAFYHLHPFHTDARIIEPPTLQDIQALQLLKEWSSARMIGVIFDGRGKWTFDITGKAQAAVAPGRPALDYGASHGYGGRLDSAFLFRATYPLLAWEENSGADGRNDRVRRFIESAGKLGVIVSYTEALQ